MFLLRAQSVTVRARILICVLVPTICVIGRSSISPLYGWSVFVSSALLPSLILSGTRGASTSLIALRSCIFFRTAVLSGDTYSDALKKSFYTCLSCYAWRAGSDVCVTRIQQHLLSLLIIVAVAHKEFCLLQSIDRLLSLIFVTNKL